MLIERRTKIKNTNGLHARPATCFAKMANKFNYNVVDGLGMLLYQAEQGFTNWYNFKPEVNHELKEFMLKND